MTKTLKKLSLWSALLGLALSTVLLPTRAAAQYDRGDDPPNRVARLGYMEGSVSMQPAGEETWVEAVPNRPMTIGDKLWADKGSRAELQLGSAVIRLGENTGCSFLNLDDHTIQVQLTSGTLNVRVRRLDRNDAIEIDTPNLAFNVDRPGNYRIEASEDGTYSVVSPRDGEGEATGNGQTYRVHAGQRATFSGTDSLNADVEQINGGDQFDTWGDGRDRRYDDSRSARYLSRDVVGYEDLDDNGDWRDDSNYGHVWYPNHVEQGWAPYHQGHWSWIAPWGYTWVDDSNWGYAPFHYGRWVTVGGRWGWVAGPIDVAPVYAPALVVFIGGALGGGGGEVGWFPLGPREVYVPPYQVSRNYMNQVNVSNTNVNTTTVTNVYNTTVVNQSTTINNVNYANRNVQGAVTVVPQRAFASAQPVARNAVAVNAQQLSRAPVAARVPVAPTREAVLGARASTAGRVTAPPPAVANRQVIAQRTPPPPPPPFAKQQQALAAHPGQPPSRQELQKLSPAANAAAHPMVRQAPPGKPAEPTTGHPNPNIPQNAGRPGQPNQPGNQQNAGRPGQPNQPGNQQNTGRPGQPNQPGNQQNTGRPGQPNPPANQQANRPPNQPGNQQEANRPPGSPSNRPGQPPLGRPEPGRPGQPPANQPPAAEQNRPGQPPANRPPAAEQNRPGQPPANRPPAAEQNRPPAAEQNRPGQPPANRPPAAEQNRPPAAEQNRPPAAEQNRPGQPPANRPPAAEQNRPGQPPANRPPAVEQNRPAEPPANRPPAQQQNRPAEPPANRPPAQQQNRPAEPPANRPPAQQQNRPAEPPANRPPAQQQNRPAEPPANRPPAQQQNRPAEPPANRPPAQQQNRPAEPPANRPPAQQQNRPAEPPPQQSRAEPRPTQPAPRPEPPAQRAPERTPPPQNHPPAEPRPAPPQPPPAQSRPAPPPSHQQTPAEKKQEEDRKKQPPGI